MGSGSCMTSPTWWLRARACSPPAPASTPLSQSTLSPPAAPSTSSLRGNSLPANALPHDRPQLLLIGHSRVHLHLVVLVHVDQSWCPEDVQGRHQISVE